MGNYYKPLTEKQLYNRHRKRAFMDTSEENPIVRFCQGKSRSITEISKKFNIKRSTLIYYLNNLQNAKIILRKRIQEGKTGRPTLIRINTRYLNDFKERQKKRDKKLDKEKLIKKAPRIAEVLEFLKKEPLTFWEVERKLYKPSSKTKTNEEIEKFNEIVEDLSEILDAGGSETPELKSEKLITIKYYITKEGKKYLEKHKRKYKKTVLNQ